MAILVVGGAGYVGSHCVKDLIEEGYQVIVVDNLYKGHVDAVDKKAKLYIGDIRDKKFLDTVFQENSITGVFHFAANSLVGESVEKPLDYFDNNVGGMISLLEIMQKHNVKKIVFSSSAAVYGQPHQIPISESDPMCPTNPYGETKLMMEKIMAWCDKAYNMKYIALRYFNVAGADKSGDIGEDHRPETHLIPLIIQAAMGKREYIEIFGDDYDTKDGTCIRDYIHIEDLIKAHILAYHKLERGCDSIAINLGSQAGYSVKEMIEATQKVVGHPIKSIVGPRRKGDPSVLVASRDLAIKELQWEPKHSNIEDCIGAAYHFHLKHKNGFKK